MTKGTRAQGILIGGGLVLAYLTRFVQDDAFISFRYAANLAGGQGLVFNAGERVEGYTNFLWTLLMAIPARTGIEPIGFAYALGLACFVGSLVVASKLARLVTGRESDSPLVLLLLGTNYSFLCYATGGLETQLQAFLLVSVACLGLADAPPSVRRALSLSAVVSLALLTRLDSIIILMPIFGVVLIRTIVAGNEIGSRKGVRLFALTAPIATTIVLWFAWKLSYYGTVIPNTALVKGADAAAIGMGLRYLGQFVRSYWMAPILLFTMFQVGTLLGSVKTRALVACLGLWCVYLVAVGGDFMEFRLLMPVLPLLFVVVVAGLPQDLKLKVALLATLIVGSVVHAATFHGVGAIESVRGLQAHVLGGEDDWREVGVALGKLFASTRPPPLIATTAIGAVPYYSGLPTVDMLGLADPEVARHGIVVGVRPGHRRLALTSYLVVRKVNFVLGHPQVLRRTGDACETFHPSDLRNFGMRDASSETIPADGRVVDFPIDAQRVLRVLYLTRTTALDEIVSRVGSRSCPIEPEVL